MNEAMFYHAVAVAARGDYHAIKKYYHAAQSRSDAGTGAPNRAGEQTNLWKVAFETLKKGGGLFPDPERSYAALEAMDIRLILASDRDFPDPLRHIPHPPFGIYVRGELPRVANHLAVAAAGMAGTALATPPILAIVGTRHASAEGKRTAHDFSHALARGGFAIASGLAFGIDAAAHEGCLEGGGATIAVLAHGLDAVAPSAHEALAEKILARGGALISEYPPGEPPWGYRFIERNRIMSGIARGVLVVEAPVSSGARATARYAAEQNRDLFVVPGSISDGHFKGSHKLIRQGAELVTSPDDIFDAYNLPRPSRTAPQARSTSPEETLILKALEEIGGTADVDKLSSMTNLEPRIANRTLTFLLMEGIIRESEEGYTIS